MTSTRNTQGKRTIGARPLGPGDDQSCQWVLVYEGEEDAMPDNDDWFERLRNGPLKAMQDVQIALLEIEHLRRENNELRGQAAKLGDPHHDRPNN